MAIDTRPEVQPAPMDVPAAPEEKAQGILRPRDFLGRSVEIVGPQRSPDPHDDPHAKNRRGELGTKLQNYYFNRFYPRDALNRMGTNTSNADGKNVLTSVISRAGRGAVNPERTPVTDPELMTRHIKKVALFFGAGQVGIAPSLPEYIYAGGSRRTEDEFLVTQRTGETPEEIAKRFPYAICTMVPWDYNMIQAHRHRVGDAAYHFSSQAGQILQNNLAGYIRELGYNVRQGAINTMPMMVAAGLGEMGRNGIVIFEKFGARGHPQVILTDMPLVPDKPIDMGVADFCQICKKCAVTCPTNSISHDEKKVINGVKKFAINWKTCYALRPHMVNTWHICLTCVTVCPFTKPNVWWRTLTINTLRALPYKLRPLLIHPLIWLDNLIWGKIPRKRVRWLGYDTAIPSEEQTCTVANCSCKQGKEPGPEVKLATYLPIKENTRRFEKNGGARTYRRQKEEALK